MSDVFAALRDGTSRECLSDLTLDRLENDELTPSEAGKVKLHLQSCARCAARRSSFQGTALEEAELPLLAARTRRAADAAEAGVASGRVEPGPPSNVVSIAKQLAPIAIAAGLAVLLVAHLLRAPSDEASVQPKGGDSLTLVVRRHGGRVERVTEGATLFANEQVRFSIDLKAPAWVTVLSLDAEGKVNVFTPEPRSLDRGAEQLLDTTVELDGTEGAERFVVVLCDQPTRLGDLVTGAERALREVNGKPERVQRINSGCREASLLVTKRR